MSEVELLALPKVSPKLHKALVAKCQENVWLKWINCDIKDGEDAEIYNGDYTYDFIKTDDLTLLKKFFKHGNWAIRQGIVYKDLAFINQINGGDEWLVLRRFGTRWVAFESYSCGMVIERAPEEFETDIKRMLKAPEEQLRKFEY